MYYFVDIALQTNGPYFINSSKTEKYYAPIYDLLISVS